MHGNAAHLICFQPLPCFHPSRPSRATSGCIIGSFPCGRLSTMRIMTSARCCGFYYFRDKGADQGKGDNRNPGRDKEPLETIEGATHGKVYLRDDSCPFNVSSFLDLYAQNLKWLCSYSGKELKIIIFSEAHLHSSVSHLIRFSSWHPRPLKIGSISSP